MNPAPPPLPVTPAKKKTNPWIIGVIILGAVGLLFGVGTFAAVLIPTVGKVRATARRTVDSSNVRQILQASLIYAAEHDGALPARMLAHDESGGGPRTPATIQGVAVELARGGGLNESFVWFPTLDASGKAADASQPILGADRVPDPAFLAQPAFAWDYVTGATTAMGIRTPIAWTRGLRRDGTWDRSGAYGREGGHIAFLGGNVQFFNDLSHAPLVTPDGEPTRDILAALPAGTRVVGAGPATLHGAEGGAP